MTSKGLRSPTRDKKSNMVSDSSDKKIGGPIRRGKPSKLSPLDEARTRAEKLRSYKADLQKMKKEKVIYHFPICFAFSQSKFTKTSPSHTKLHMLFSLDPKFRIFLFETLC